MSATLDPAMATRLEKVAVDNGFDREDPRDGAWLAFASTQAPLRLWLTPLNDLLVTAVSMAQVDASLAEHGRPIQLPLPAGAVAARTVTSLGALHRLVRRAFRLSRTLPDALLDTFISKTASLPKATEAERLVVQRIGQDIFRAGLLDYWQGRCVITGLATSELLRASHIQPWAACETDGKRLDVFNGLLLSPNLDAAFDCGFITVGDDGAVVVSELFPVRERQILGIDRPLRVTGLTPQHALYLAYHRSHVFRRGPVATAINTRFRRYVGIDYSGAETPTSGLTGIRVYTATPETAPVEERNSGGHWSRKSLAKWLVRELSAGLSTIVGIDHCFSFPRAYFEAHGLAPDWTAFLDDFCEHWPTDQDHVYVDFVRDAVLGNGAARQGNTRWRRTTEIRAGGAKSAFHFDVPGSVAKSTHAGVPWLRYIRKGCGGTVHFWPFDGWSVPKGRSVIAEVYPSLWRDRYPRDGVNEHQRDAYAIAAWLRESDQNGSLTSFLSPGLTAEERAVAVAEGWILGVG
jgi:hypothetical protein